jgi:hypothetical protein
MDEIGGPGSDCRRRRVPERLGYIVIDRDGKSAAALPIPISAVSSLSPFCVFRWLAESAKRLCKRINSRHRALELPRQFSCETATTKYLSPLDHRAPGRKPAVATVVGR